MTWDDILVILMVAAFYGMWVWFYFVGKDNDKYW